MKNSFLAVFAVALLTAPAIAADAPKQDYFSRIDSNGDGFVSKDEWRVQGDKLFADRDLNHDGKISKDEMTAYYKAQRAELDAKHAAWIATHGAATPAPAKK